MKSTQTESRSTITPSAVFRYKEHQPLHAIFEPTSIAVIGATERPASVGRSLLENLTNGSFGGKVFPVNPRRTQVLGIKAYPNLAALPQPVDLAIIATPASAVPNRITECVDAGVKGAIILSAGFKESGEAGEAMERQILAQARRGNLRVIGPNRRGLDEGSKKTDRGNADDGTRQLDLQHTGIHMAEPFRLIGMVV